MSQSILISGLGVSVAIDLTGLDEADAHAVREAWADATVTGGDIEDALATVRPTATPEPGRLLHDLSQQVTSALIEARRGDLWMLHAAGLANADGRVVVVVGPSGRGKTTASRTLARELGYVSDETVAIERDGTVWAYRKPLSIIAPGSFYKTQVAPTELGLAPLPLEPLTVAAIVLLDRVEAAPDETEPFEPRLETLDLGDALGDLVSQTSYLSDVDRPLQLIEHLAGATDGIRRVSYTEASTLLPTILSLFDEERAPSSLANVRALAPSMPTVDRTQSSATPSGEPGTVEPQFSRAPFIDVITLDDPDRLAILHVDDEGSGTVRVLAGIGPTLWRAANGASLSRLTDAALAEYGAPDDLDATQFVTETVETLMGEGVLTTEPIWQVRDDAAWIDSGDRVVALALATLQNPAPLALEGSAALIWRALGDGKRVKHSTLLTRLSSETGLDAADLDDDTTTFLDALVEARLVERS